MCEHRLAIQKRRNGVAPIIAPSMADARLRRLHALAGVIPLGVFVVVHLLVNASALAGPSRFDRIAGGLARNPLSIFVDVVFVGIPLAFHGLYGLRRAFERQPDAEESGYKRPRLDVLMRVTSIVLFLFVIAHTLEMRLGRSVGALHTKLTMDLSWTKWGVPLIAFGYLLGIAAVAFHLAYGCFAVLESRGRASRRAAIASVAGGTLLFMIGAATVIAFSGGGTLIAEPDPSREVPCPAPSP
jgi:succinate dehydrogenase / fumarate reductase cytochrome b subunit